MLLEHIVLMHFPNRNGADFVSLFRIFRIA